MRVASALTRLPIGSSVSVANALKRARVDNRDPVVLGVKRKWADASPKLPERPGRHGRVNSRWSALGLRRYHKLDSRLQCWGTPCGRVGVRASSRSGVEVCLLMSDAARTPSAYCCCVLALDLSLVNASSPGRGGVLFGPFGKSGRSRRKPVPEAVSCGVHGLLAQGRATQAAQSVTGSHHRPHYTRPLDARDCAGSTAPRHAATGLLYLRPCPVSWLRVRPRFGSTAGLPDFELRVLGSLPSPTASASPGRCPATSGDACDVLIRPKV